MAAKIMAIFILITLILLSIFVFFNKKSSINTKITQTERFVEDIKDTVAPKPTTITETGLPDSHLIKTAFVPQAPFKDWSEPWQDACEEASLLTVRYYYINNNPTPETIKTDILSMIAFEQKQGWSDSVNVSQMAVIAKDYLNLTPKTITNPSVLDIKTYIAANTPIIVPAAGKVLYQENKNFKSGGPYYHNLVILGYNDQKQQFTVHDVGTQYGAYFHYSYSLLMSAIHDFPVSGNKEDINSGSKTVLVLVK
jgi:hypothetical protein